MTQSMTGYGRGEKGSFVTEIRSFNHRFLDISVRLPRSLLALEVRIKKGLQDKFSRGRFEVSITRKGETEARSLVVDRWLAQQYYKMLEGLKKEFNLKGDIDIALMSYIKELITITEKEEDIEGSWKDIEGALHDSMAELIRMRKDEGKFLREDLFKRVNMVGHCLDTVEARCPQVVQNYRERLLEKVRSVIGGIDMDEGRLYLEVALFAERCDVTEEIVRAKSHLGQFRKMLEGDGSVGKKLDFLIQEIGREINTISSKASDIEISKEVIEIKGELEKMREQVQNIE